MEDSKDPYFTEQIKFYAEKKKQKYEDQRNSIGKSKTSTAPNIQHQTYTVQETTGLVSGREEERTSSSCLKCPSFECVGCCEFQKSSVKLFSIPFPGGPVPLHIHYLWPVFIILSALSSLNVSGLYSLYSLILGGPILFTTVLIHELGHAYMAVKLGGNVDRILLWPLGGLAYISFFGETSPKSDALVAIAGPLTHIPQVLFWMLLMSISNHGDVELNWELKWGFDFWVSLCAGAIGIQIGLFLFNLIPAYPLDGGRILGAFLAYMNFNRNRVFQISAFIGGIIGWFMLFDGITAIFTDSVGFFKGWNELFLAIFILYNCQQLWSYAAVGAATLHPGYKPINQGQWGNNNSNPRSSSGERPVGRGLEGGVYRMDGRAPVVNGGDGGLEGLRGINRGLGVGKEGEKGSGEGKKKGPDKKFYTLLDV